MNFCDNFVLPLGANFLLPLGAKHYSLIGKLIHKEKFLTGKSIFIYNLVKYSNILETPC